METVKKTIFVTTILQKKNKVLPTYCCAAVLAILFVLIVLVVFTLFLTIEFGSIGFFSIAIAPAMVIALGIGFGGYYLFTRAGVSWVWMFESFFAGGVMSIAVIFLYVIVVLILAVVYLMDGVHTLQETWSAIVYSLSKDLATISLSGFQLAVSASLISFVQSCTSEGMIILFFFVYLFSTKKQSTKTKIPNIIVCICFSFGLNFVVNLLWVYIYETFYVRECTYCFVFPFEDSSKWLTNISAIWNRMIVRLLLGISNGFVWGVFFNFYIDTKSWIYVLIGLFFSFNFSFFFDLFLYGFGGKLIFGSWWDVVVNSLVLIGILFLAVGVDSVLALAYIRFYNRTGKSKLSRKFPEKREPNLDPTYDLGFEETKNETTIKE